MRPPPRSLRRALAPALVALHALALTSCETGTQPTMVEVPSFDIDDQLNARNGHGMLLTAPDSSIVVGESVQATGIPVNKRGKKQGKSVRWSVTPAAVARVSSSGLITGVAPGTATVSASADPNVKRSMTITVVAARADEDNDGGDDKVGDDDNGDNGDNDGDDNDDGAGADGVDGDSSGDDSDSTATSPVVHTVSISANATTLKIGESTQISGVVRDSNHTPIPDVSVSWSTSQTNVATVESTSPTAGLVRARGIGKSTVYAKADTTVRSITVTVIDSATSAPSPSAPVPAGGSGGSYGSATAAELPRTSVNIAYPTPNRRVRVPAGASLQAAIDAAQAGDELLLTPGAVYSGNFYLRNKGVLNGWITIRTDLSDASIGAPGTRMTPSRAASAKLARIVTPNIYSALTTELGANHYRFTGVEIAVSSWVSDMNALVRLGESQKTQNSASTTASYLVFDRTYIHGNPSGQLRRCVMLNSAMTALVDSWLGECHSNASESQAIVGWNGPGPYLIQNNHLEGGHEVIMFGGGGVSIQNLSPSDITIRGNHIMRPTSWKGVWQAKNLIESKHARRMLIENNVIENTWADAQVGFAFVMKSENQNWDAPWTQTTDVTIRYNRIRNVGSVFNLAAKPAGAPAVPAARFVISDNIIENVGNGMFSGDGRTFQLLPGLADIVLMHNTVVSAGGANPASIYFAGGGISRLVVHSNILHHGKAGVKGDGTTEGTISLNRFASGALYSNNAMAHGGTLSQYPTNNWFPATFAELGFVNFSGGDYLLSGTSGFANKGYDGRNIGADISQVKSRTSSAVVAK